MQAFGSTRMMSGDTAADYDAIACSYARHLSDELIGKLNRTGFAGGSNF